MAETTSADGTTITYDSWGDGPLVVVVGGAFNDRGTWAQLARALADQGFARCPTTAGAAEPAGTPSRTPWSASSRTSPRSSTRRDGAGRRTPTASPRGRSEERRGGKECRSRWSAYH